MRELQTVLVVEDNVQNLELVEFLLEEAGVTVRAAADAEAATEILSSFRPDLVLMDMQLPGTDGLSLVRQLRRAPSTVDLPIVALTAHAMRGDRERFLAGGCDGYVAKPIDTVRFIDQIRSIWHSAVGEGES